MRLALCLAAGLFVLTLSSSGAADVLPPSETPGWQVPAPRPQPKDASVWLAVAIAALALGGVAVNRSSTQ